METADPSGDSQRIGSTIVITIRQHNNHTRLRSIQELSCRDESITKISISGKLCQLWDNIEKCRGVRCKRDFDTNLGMTLATIFPVKTHTWSLNWTNPIFVSRMYDETKVFENSLIRAQSVFSMEELPSRRRTTSSSSKHSTQSEAERLLKSE